MTDTSTQNEQKEKIVVDPERAKQFVKNAEKMDQQTKSEAKPKPKEEKPTVDSMTVDQLTKALNSFDKMTQDLVDDKDKPKVEDGDDTPLGTIQHLVEAEYLGLLKGITEEEVQVMEGISSTNYFEIPYLDYFNYLKFDKKLELIGVSKEQAGQVCDSVVLGGVYKRAFKIRSLDVEISSREAEIYFKAVNEATAKGLTRMKLMEAVALHNCAGSLVKYGDKEFPMYRDVPRKDRDAYLQAKMDFLMDLPSPVYNILSREIVKLDLLVNTAVSPEGLENL